ncbi:hypothetical protein BLOT_007770 [Blomia tropicalis]|nr:hypothetical protein BLOT_007770 [Blomia tropicalis]
MGRTLHSHYYGTPTQYCVIAILSMQYYCYLFFPVRMQPQMTNISQDGLFVSPLNFHIEKI